MHIQSKPCPFCRSKMLPIDPIALLKLQRMDAYPMPPPGKPIRLQEETLPLPMASYRCEDCRFVASFDE